VQKPTQAALLGILTIFSIGLITSTDRVASFVLPSSLETLAYIRIPSILLCFFLWVAVGQRSAFHFPIQSIQWRRVLVPACMWLVPTAFLVLSHTVWVPYISKPLDIVAFMVTGLLAEEFLFRGAIYDLVLRVFEGHTASKVAVGYSALFFGLGHLQYHNFSLTESALTQISYTIVMGVFFGIVRERSGSIWPCVLMHVMNNSFTLIVGLT